MRGRTRRCIILLRKVCDIRLSSNRKGGLSIMRGELTFVWVDNKRFDVEDIVCKETSEVDPIYSDREMGCAYGLTGVGSLNFYQYIDSYV